MYIYVHIYIYIYMCIYIYIYIYVDCDWQHWQRISSSQSTTALSDCFSLPGHKSDHGASRGSTPRQQELSKLKATAGCKVLLWIFFWGPLVQSSKCGLAQSLWLKHTEANDPPSPYPMGTPEPCMCYGCELW